MNHAGANQGGQHGQAIPRQDSRVWNDTLQTPQDFPHRPSGLVYRPSSETARLSSAGQDDGRREGDETQSQNVQSQIPVAPYTRNAYAGTMPEGPGTRRDMNGHNFVMSSLGDAYTNNTTNGSRGMIDPTLRSDNDNAVFLAPPYAHDLSVYEPQSSAAPMPDDQEFSDMSDGEIHDTSMDDELRAYDALPDVVLDYPCPVGSCPRRDRPFARWEEYMRHISRSNDRAHARLRAEIRRRGV